MILTVIESPYAGDVTRNLAYVRACMRAVLLEGGAPLASHALYTQEGVLDDTVPEERALGIEAGFVIGDAMLAGAIMEAATKEFFTGTNEHGGRALDVARAHRVVFFIDLGWSLGMKRGLDRATKRHSPCFTRTLGAPWSDLAPSSARLEGT